MPQIGNVCPGTDLRQTFASGYCLHKCENPCMPASVLVHIENRQRVDKHQGEYISVTGLLNCLRKTVAERSVPYYVEPPNAWWSLRGTIIHNILQNPDFASKVDDLRDHVYRLFKTGEISRDALEMEWVALEASLQDFARRLPRPALQDWEAEVEYEYPLGLINGRYRYVRGTIDVLRRKMGQIVDYKTMGDKGIGIVKDGPKVEHEWQFNMYRLLVERGYPVGSHPSIYTPVKINEIKAYYMTMMQVVGTGTNMEVISQYQITEPQNHPNMITKEIIDTRTDRVCKRGKRRDSQNPDDFELSTKNRWKMVYAVPKVKLYDLDKVEEFVNRQARHLVDSFDTDTLPMMAPPETRQWLCNLCPSEIQAACDAKNAEDGVERKAEEVFEPIPVEA